MINTTVKIERMYLAVPSLEWEDASDSCETFEQAQIEARQLGYRFVVMSIFHVDADGHEALVESDTFTLDGHFIYSQSADDDDLTLANKLSEPPRTDKLDLPSIHANTRWTN